METLKGNKGQERTKRHFLISSESHDPIFIKGEKYVPWSQQNEVLTLC
jgi:hypothetical protein